MGIATTTNAAYHSYSCGNGSATTRIAAGNAATFPAGKNIRTEEEYAKLKAYIEDAHRCCRVPELNCSLPMPFNYSIEYNTDGADQCVFTTLEDLIKEHDSMGAVIAELSGGFSDER